MIGQAGLLKKLNQLWLEDRFPRFSIIQGGKGSGKRTVLGESIKGLGTLVIGEGKVDEVREIIETAANIKSTTPILFYFPHGENMTTAAQNALLKIIEEPSPMLYFMIGTSPGWPLPRTLENRSTGRFFLDPYTYDELHEFSSIYTKLSREETDKALVFCTTTGELNIFAGYEIDDYIEFCEKVRDNLSKTSLSNAMKITSNLKLKEDGKGWDLELFFTSMANLILDKAKIEENPEEAAFFAWWSGITLESMRTLSRGSFSKLGILDLWIMNTRDAARLFKGG